MRKEDYGKYTFQCVSSKSCVLQKLRRMPTERQATVRFNSIRRIALVEFPGKVIFTSGAFACNPGPGMMFQ